MDSTLNTKDFEKVSRFIKEQCGIKMPLAKKIMLESRLRKRSNELGLASLEEYCRFLFTSGESAGEIVHMIDVVTTNKTDFFREPRQFDYLTNTVLPEFISSKKDKKIRLWSAGCSSGEEPYTLAMILSEYFQDYPGLDYSILATDISTSVLKKAVQAIYDLERVAPVPLQLKKKYLLKSKDKTNNLVRIVPELRTKVDFRRLNFLDTDYQLRDRLDIIFCRNVIIYFDKITQEEIISKLVDKLENGGYLFLGHSETVFGMDLPLRQAAPSIYMKL